MVMVVLPLKQILHTWRGELSFLCPQICCGTVVSPQKLGSLRGKPGGGKCLPQSSLKKGLSACQSVPSM